MIYLFLNNDNIINNVAKCTEKNCRVKYPDEINLTETKLIWGRAVMVAIVHPNSHNTNRSIPHWLIDIETPLVTF